jgi:hypothetical protein
MSKQHTIGRGDCLLSVVAQSGLGDWERVWGAAENDALRRKRASPFVLLPGDQLSVPVVSPKHFQGPTSITHQFVLKRLRTRLRIQLRQRHGSGFEFPLSDAGCRFDIDGNIVDATSDSQGWVEVRVEPLVRKIELTVAGTDKYPPLGWCLYLGELLPYTEEQGAINRLVNLGYQAMAEDPAVYTPYALRAFQEDSGIPVTGQFDEATLSELARRHQL